eukprot:s1098_g14.t1
MWPSLRNDPPPCSRIQGKDLLVNTLSERWGSLLRAWILDIDHRHTGKVAREEIEHVCEFHGIDVKDFWQSFAASGPSKPQDFLALEDLAPEESANLARFTQATRPVSFVNPACVDVPRSLAPAEEEEMGLADDELVHPASVSPILRCPICTDVFAQPVACGTCQQVFCRHCIEKALAMSEASQCPTCRTPMGKKLQPSLVVSSLLNELHVRCMNVGCYWTGRYDERHAHDARCSRNLRRCQDLKLQLEQACCILQAKDKEVSELKAIVEKLNGQNTKFEEKVKLQQLQLNAKQSMLDFKHQEADDLKSQLSQAVAAASLSFEDAWRLVDSEGLGVVTEDVFLRALAQIGGEVDGALLFKGLDLSAQNSGSIEDPWALLSQSGRSGSQPTLASPWQCSGNPRVALAASGPTRVVACLAQTLVVACSAKILAVAFSGRTVEEECSASRTLVAACLVALPQEERAHLAARILVEAYLVSQTLEGFLATPAVALALASRREVVSSVSKAPGVAFSVSPPLEVASLAAALGSLPVEACLVSQVSRKQEGCSDRVLVAACLDNRTLAAGYLDSPPRVACLEEEEGLEETKLKYAHLGVMDCYKNKSFEELRMEDYQANRLQAGQGAPAPGGLGGGTTSPFGASSGGGMFGQNTGGGLFGQNTGGGGLFGQNTGGGLFGQNTGGGLFGANTGGGMFGGNTGGMFGQNTGGGLFGQNTGGGLFGQSSGGGLFGANTGGGLFGQNTGGGLFGQNTGGGGLFGQNTGGGLFGQNTGGGLFGQNTGGGMFGQSAGGGLFGGGNTGGGLFGANSGGGLFGKPNSGGGLFGANTGGGLFGANSGGGGLFGGGNTGGGLFGNPGGGLFGGNTGGGMFGQNTGGGLFGQNTGGGLFGQNTGGGLFGNTGGGLFGQSSGGGMFGANTGGGLFGNTGGGLFGNTGGGLFGNTGAGGGLFGNSGGGGLFGAKSSGGGLFGASSQGGLFGANTGGGLFGNTGAGGGLFGGSGGGLFGANSGGGLFGANSGGGLFGQNTGGGLFGAPAGGSLFGTPGAQMGQMGAMSPMDPYGLNGLVTNQAPPRPLGLTMPKTPSKATSAYLWKSQPESAARVKPSTPSRSASEGSFAERSPRSGAFSLPPSAVNEFRSYGSTPRSRPQTPTSGPEVSPSAFLRVSMKSPRSPAPPSPRRTPDDMMPPLRKPRETQPLASTSAQMDGTTGGTGTPTAPAEVSTPTLKPIKPNIIRHGPDRLEQETPKNVTPAAASLEAMSRMTEAQLSRIDNLEIGRYGYGSVKWPGLTDVRCHDFDRDLRIERGSLTLYAEREKPEVGQGLNKEAVVTLHVKPTRSDVKPKSLELLQSRLSKLSEDFGGKFISYDMEKWIFRGFHFLVKLLLWQWAHFADPAYAEWDLFESWMEGKIWRDEFDFVKLLTPGGWPQTAKASEDAHTPAVSSQPEVEEEVERYFLRWVLPCWQPLQDLFVDKNSAEQVNGSKQPSGSERKSRSVAAEDFVRFLQGLRFKADARTLVRLIFQRCEIEDKHRLREGVESITLSQLQSFRRKAEANLLKCFCEALRKTRGTVLRAWRLDLDVRGSGFIAQARGLSAQDFEALSIRELQDLARQRGVDLEDCFEKRDLVEKLRKVASGKTTFSTCQADPSTGDDEEVASMSITELRALIHEAGLSSRDLLERKEFLQRAKEAKKILRTQAKTEEASSEASSSKAAPASSTKGQLPWDVRRYQELEIVLFARGGCPHCVAAFELLKRRGLANFDLQDVEWSKEAVQEFRRLGGNGVPFFYSKRTGKSLSGWKPDATDLEWLVQRLA